jgi:YceI-like domain
MSLKRFRILQLALVLASHALGVASEGQVRSIDTANSKLLVHTFKSGLFSGFADNHAVEAPFAEGTVDEGALCVKFVVDSRRMRVLDPQLEGEKRRKIQERMLGPEVLDSTHFPQITFESTNIQRVGQGRLLVAGRLSLHGVTRPISVTVHNENGHYLGTCVLKQRDFGIAPISIAGGTVKVKDELNIEFDIRTETQAAGNGK